MSIDVHPTPEPATKSGAVAGDSRSEPDGVR
jgi:hypothetical protein